MSRVLAVGLVALVWLAAPAHAQTARPTARQVAGWTAVGTACGVFAGVLAFPGGPPLMVLAMPVGAAKCVSDHAEDDGFGGSFGGTLKDAALGAVLGVGVGYVVASGTIWVLTNTGTEGGDGLGIALVGAAAGAVALTATSAYVAARRVHRHGASDMAPVAFRLPDGTTALGLSVRVGL